MHSPVALDRIRFPHTRHFFPRNRRRRPACHARGLCRRLPCSRLFRLAGTARVITAESLNTSATATGCTEESLRIHGGTGPSEAFQRTRPRTPNSSTTQSLSCILIAGDATWPPSLPWRRTPRQHRHAEAGELFITAVLQIRDLAEKLLCDGLGQLRDATAHGSKLFQQACRVRRGADTCPPPSAAKRSDRSHHRRAITAASSSGRVTASS